MKTTAVFKGLVLLALLVGTQAQAVIIAGGDGQGNTNAPTGDQGWSYVGRINKANTPSSVVYLGSNWFITCYHVYKLDNPTGVILNASSYAIQTSTWTRITNNVGNGVDLAMFRVSGTLANAPLSIPTSDLANGRSVTMIGYGLDRQTNLTYWTSNWSVTNSSGVYSGYVWGANNGIKRWGTNSTLTTTDFDGGYGLTHYYVTRFDSGAGASEAQGATFDSGGGMFYDPPGPTTYQVAGIMGLVGENYTNQPGNAAVFDNSYTYIADLTTYRSQILNTMSVIPEPGTALLLLGTSALLGAVRSLRRLRRP